MSTRQDAEALLDELCSSMPRSFYSKLELTQRGFGFVLDYLERADGEVIAGDLAKKMNVSTARVAALLKRMEQNGFITRRASLKDARRTVVDITPAGIAFVDNMREQTLSKVMRLLDRISKEDLAAYIRISHQIREAMNEQADLT